MNGYWEGYAERGMIGGVVCACMDMFRVGGKQHGVMIHVIV